MSIVIGQAVIKVNKKGDVSMRVGDGAEALVMPLAKTALGAALRLAASGHAGATVDDLQTEALKSATGEEFKSATKSPRKGKKPGPKPGSKRKSRRTPKNIERDLQKIVAVLKVAKRTKERGLRTELIRKQTGISRAALQAPLALGIEKKLLTKKGKRRQTMYFAK